MTATLGFALVVIGIVLVLNAILGTDKTAGHRAMSASGGLLCLLLGALLRGDRDHHDRRDWS